MVRRQDSLIVLVDKYNLSIQHCCHYLQKQRAPQEIIDQDEGCLSDFRSEFPSSLLFLRSAVNPQGAFLGQHFLGYVFVAVDKKVSHRHSLKYEESTIIPRRRNLTTKLHKPKNLEKSGGVCFNNIQ